MYNLNYKILFNSNLIISFTLLLSCVIIMLLFISTNQIYTMIYTNITWIVSMHFNHLRWLDHWLMSLKYYCIPYYASLESIKTTRSIPQPTWEHLETLLANLKVDIILNVPCTTLMKKSKCVYSRPISEGISYLCPSWNNSINANLNVVHTIKIHKPTHLTVLVKFLYHFWL